MRDDGPTISLYRLERLSSIHRDTIARFAMAAGIPVIRVFNVRCISLSRLDDLNGELEAWKGRPRPWGKPPGGLRR